jgi:peptidyl-prolyl cis-trans isomerase C
MSCSLNSVRTQDLRRVVSVNGVVIRHDDISRETQNHPASTPIAAWTAAARALAVRELLLQEAHRKDIVATPCADAEGRTETAEEASIRELVDREISTPIPDEAACRRYYQQNLKRFRSANLYEAAHILFAARPDDRAAYGAARAEAEAVTAALRAAPARFAELAETHSACPSKVVGGSLGQLTRGDTVAEFDAALRVMAPGEITTEPVASRFGHHIIRLDRKIEGRALSFEVVRERIADYLVDRARRIAIAQFVARLTSRAEITGVDLPNTSDLRVS